MRIAGVGLCALAWVACVQDDAFECGQNDECVQGGIRGVCQIDGYCSFPDPMCESGQRYGSLAPQNLAEACVPPGPDVIDTSGEVVTDGGDGSDGGQTATGGMSDSNGGTTADPGTTTSTTSDETSTTAESGSASASAGDSTGGVADCIDVDLGSAVGDVDERSLGGQGNDFDPTCYGGDGNDVAYAWVAPLRGEYEFVAQGGINDTGIMLYDACGGAELACNDDGALPFSGLVRREVEQGESLVIVVDSSAAEMGSYILQITLVTE